MNTESDSLILLRASCGAGRGRVNLGTATLRTRASVPAGHKVAVRLIEKGAPILKYVGSSVLPRDIEAGQHVHTHNVEMSAVGDEHIRCTAYEAPELNESPA
ncbi:MULTISPECIES: SAF domain-containing protein [unclassified Paraburkholderia]|uniref:SAF domain-containing protein n=1 Tax=Paraburkholderia sp. WSM4177 TaxID=2723098 RepID=UPI00161100BB|nr:MULTISPECIES: SAF domain-containing protein [unclassified Paraburkholderia]MBB5443775.1 hypothetical protein [Paraburkholderia sp. WSM4177]MBB5485098.1 hypothetical protein [Paraburkholderia sp. WSM4180]